MAERVVYLSVTDWTHPGGARKVKTPFPADPVEEFIDWLRENRQWRNAPEMLANRAQRFLRTLDKVGPLAEDGSAAPGTPQKWGPDAPVLASVPKGGIPCPYCQRSFRMLPHLQRHKNAMHKAEVAAEVPTE